MPKLVFLLLALALLLGAHEGVASSAETVPTNCNAYVGLTNKIAGCIRQTIDAGAGRFFAEIYPWLERTIGAVMTLAVIIYGILMSYGMVERIGRDSMILLFKLAVVIGFTANSPLLYNSAISMMDATSAAVVNFSPPSGTADNAGSDFSKNKCMKNMIEQQKNSDPSKPITGPWLGMDCLLDSVIGIRMSDLPSTLKWFNDQQDSNSTTTPKEGMSRGYLFLFFSGMQSSVMGFVFAIIGFVFLYGLVMLIIKAFYTYVSGYMGIALMIIVSPLFIPLILFHNTKEYFDKWVKLTISFGIQPIVMLVFIIFSLSAIDFAAFSGNYSIVYRMAGNAARQPGFNMNDYLQAPRLASGAVDPANPPAATSKSIILKTPRTLATIKADSPKPVPVAGQDTQGIAKGAITTKCTKEAIAADTAGALKACAFGYPVKVTGEFIDWDKMALARGIMGPPVTPDAGKTAGQKIAGEVLSSVLFCAIVVFVMNGLLAVVPFMAYDLMGDFGQSPNIGMAGGGGFTGGSKIISNFTSKMKNIAGGG